MDIAVIEDVFEGTSVFSLGLLNTLVLTLIVFGAVFCVTRLITHLVKKKIGADAMFASRLINAVIIIIAVSALLMTITPLQHFATAMLASSGVVAIIIGLAAQEALGNVFSGFSIGISKPFRIGEYVSIVSINVAGVVEEMGLRHTVIRNAENNRIIVPNSVINKEILVTSYSADPDICNLFDVGISYDSDVDKAIDIIRKAVSSHPSFMDRRTPEEKERGVPSVTVRMTAFEESSIVLRALVWTKDVPSSYQILSDIRMEIKREFDAQGIEIPFPHMKVILKDEKES